MSHRLAFAVSALALLTACTTPQYNYRPSVQEISRPPLGSVNVANVGDEMISQGTYSEQAAIKLSKPIKIGLFGTYTLTPGYYVKTGEDSSSSFYRPASGRDAGQVKAAGRGHGLNVDKPELEEALKSLVPPVKRNRAGGTGSG